MTEVCRRSVPVPCTGDAAANRRPRGHIQRRARECAFGAQVSCADLCAPVNMPMDSSQDRRGAPDGNYHAGILAASSLLPLDGGLRFAADIVGDAVDAAHHIDDLACQVAQRAAGSWTQSAIMKSLVCIAGSAATWSQVQSSPITPTPVAGTKSANAFLVLSYQLLPAAGSTVARISSMRIASGRCSSADNAVLLLCRRDLIRWPVAAIHLM